MRSVYLLIMLCFNISNLKIHKVNAISVISIFTLKFWLLKLTLNNRDFQKACGIWIFDILETGIYLTTNVISMPEDIYFYLYVSRSQPSLDRTATSKFFVIDLAEQSVHKILEYFTLVIVYKIIKCIRKNCVKKIIIVHLWIINQ